ncbi:hypothetical protein JGS22_005810 [Streptomyces sp. P38-E01]|uniref:Uncharacterized protein n=1 Tax=Streptomyces tardus TaxID=2780544 RepID=A0A949JC78_9ACTN|nr:hypothetical protein [Streptomyces tardus]MBU7597161.1 hypothetical protein [Streptomyces tardus]
MKLSTYTGTDPQGRTHEVHIREGRLFTRVLECDSCGLRTDATFSARARVEDHLRTHEVETSERVVHLARIALAVIIAVVVTFYIVAAVSNQ